MLSRRNVYLLVMVLVGLGTVLFLLPGCGSDSKPDKEKVSTNTKPMKSQAALPLVLGDKTGAGSRGQARKPSGSQRIEVMGGMTQEELEAKAAASLAEMKKAAKTRGPIMGGMTQEQLEAKAEESRQQMEKARKTSVIMGGMTQEQLEAKAEESRKRLELKGGGEIFPGITQRELEEMAARGREQRREPSPQEMFPGATQEQLDAARQ